MHIVNAMFAKGEGGIEQASLDYCAALELQGDRVTAFVHPGAAIRGRTTAQVVAIGNHGQWDILAVLRLRLALRKLKPDAVIAHGNRAVSLMRQAARGICPVVGVTHNYSIGRFGRLDAAFAVTQDLEKKLLEAGFPGNRIFRVPNMVRCSERSAVTPLRHPPTIATLGRFVKKKGFDVWILALAELRAQGREFRAVIGGAGDGEHALRQLVKKHNLSDTVTFAGWVENKEQFFKEADIFVLPSAHEPFGIVLLEAMASGLPIVTTDSEGPSEIVRHEHDALVVPRNDPRAMAEAVARLMDDVPLAGTLAANALETVQAKYDIKAVGAVLHKALEQVVHG